jgi:hypothetical protein
MSASALKPARRWPRYLAGGFALLFLLLMLFSWAYVRLSNVMKD